MLIAWPEATGKDDIRGRGCLRNYSNAVRMACGVVLRCRRKGGGWCAIAAPRKRRHQQRDCIRIDKRGTRRRTDLLMCRSNCWSFRLIIYVTFHVNTITPTTITLSNSFPNHAALS
jgi:hypothetical protein